MRGAPAFLPTLGLVAVAAGVAVFGPEPDRYLKALSPELPVEVQGRAVGGWQRVGSGWRGQVRVLSLRQGIRQLDRAPPLSLYVPGERRPRLGGTLTVRGYLRSPSAARNGPPGRRGPWRLSVSSPRLLRVDTDGTVALLSGWAEGWRHRIETRLSSAEGGELGRALLLGDTSELPPGRLIALRRLGLGHLVAVSGLHLGLAVSALWLAGWSLPVRLRLLVAGAVVPVYLLLVGPRPSLVRSGGMVVLVMVSLACDRRPQVLNCWAVAVGAMVAWSPIIVADVGFQLTAAATLGLIFLTPPLRRRWSGCLGRPLATAMAVSVGAHVSTLPWSAGVFHLWSPISILLNLVVVPWTTVTMLVAGAVAFFQPVPWFGRMASAALGVMAAPYGWLEAMPARWPWSVPVQRPAWVMACVALALAVGLVRLRLLPLVAMVAAAGTYLLFGLGAADRGVELVALDVGQGDAIVLRDGAEAVLVDGGGWRGQGVGQRVLLPALLRLGLRRLDGVVLTHADRDHCAGLTEIAGLIPVAVAWARPGWEGECYLRLIRQPGVRLAPLWQGRRLRVGRWRVEVLSPPAGSRVEGNEGSLVLLAHIMGWKVVLTADVGAEVEERLSSSAPEALAASVLKVGHHGSRFSTTAPFLRRVAPRVALVSVGRDNLYGHPAPEVMDRLATLQVDSWRTDRGGQIRLRFTTGCIEVDQPWSDSTRRTVIRRSGVGVSYNALHAPPCRHRRADGHRQDRVGPAPE